MPQYAKQPTAQYYPLTTAKTPYEDEGPYEKESHGETNELAQPPNHKLEKQDTGMLSANVVSWFVVQLATGEFVVRKYEVWLEMWINLFGFGDFKVNLF